MPDVLFPSINKMKFGQDSFIMFPFKKKKTIHNLMFSRKLLGNQSFSTKQKSNWYLF